MSSIFNQFTNQYQVSRTLRLLIFIMLTPTARIILLLRDYSCLHSLERVQKIGVSH